jgi:hypothetical protein
MISLWPDDWKEVNDTVDMYVIAVQTLHDELLELTAKSHILIINKDTIVTSTLHVSKKALLINFSKVS